ncbi:MAG: hypothetical protein Hens3KO_22120 [Henriciella sp.]
MPSQLLTKLRADIEVAKGIVSRVPETECKTNLQGLSLQSFILLVHAAFESYLEQTALNAIIRATDKFKNNGEITKTLVALLVSNSFDELSEKSKSRIREDVTRSFEVAIESAKKRFSHTIRNNNGIKADDQRSILLPAGIDPEFVEPTVFHALNTFGGSRGAIAHGFQFIRHEHTKSSVLGEISTILHGLREYERAIEQALNDSAGSSEVPALRPNL